MAEIEEWHATRDQVRVDDITTQIALFPDSSLQNPGCTNLNAISRLYAAIIAFQLPIHSV
jgi:hypothetical protein